MKLEMKRKTGRTRRFYAGGCLLAAATLFHMAGMSAASATNLKYGPVVTEDTLQVAGKVGVKPDTAPVRIKTVTPEYPRRALAIEREGWVIVELDIDHAGVPVSAEIVETGPSSLFNASALEAVEEFRFEPATYEGVPVAVTGQRYKVVYAFGRS